MESIKRHKKGICVVLGIIVVLFICYLIGQNVVLPKRMRSAGYTDVDGNVPEYSIMENINTFSFGGQEEMDDVPGGQTISVLELNQDSNVSEDMYGKYIFMTPGTSFANRITLNKKCDTLSFMYGIHPWIDKEVSDGIQIVVEVYTTEGDKPNIRETFDAKVGEKMKLANVDLSSVAGEKVTIGISCTAGENDDESGDWAIICYPVIE